MAVVSTSFEFNHALPAEDLFQIITKFHELAPKAAPEHYKSISVEGEIGAGTIQTSTYGDGDILGDSLESITHQLKISPSGDGGSVYKHSIDFKCKGDAKPTEEFITRTVEGLKSVFKAIEAHIMPARN